MDAKDVLVLGLGVTPPWRLADQRLDTSRQPHVLEILLEADRGAEFPCPECGGPCKAHDFKEFTRRHLNFFQHHCLITARVPRTDCPEHGVKRASVPWAREGSGFTLLFEQAAMTLVREMPVLAVARFIGITDKRLWRIVEYYVAKALRGLDLSGLTAFALDEKERQVRLYIRGDAAFASLDLYEYLKAEGILYAIRLPANKVLQ